jgi:hypothetical protein
MVGNYGKLWKNDHTLTLPPLQAFNALVKAQARSIVRTWPLPRWPKAAATPQVQYRGNRVQAHGEDLMEPPGIPLLARAQVLCACTPPTGIPIKGQSTKQKQHNGLRARLALASHGKYETQKGKPIQGHCLPITYHDYLSNYLIF